MIWASTLLVFGTVAWLFMNMQPSDQLVPGFEQIIHANVPWLILATLWLGGGLGIAAAIRRGRWFIYPVVVFELLLVGLVSFYFLRISWLPEHLLAVGVGDAFPTYQLADQDLRQHEAAIGTPREPALYIFYRGDW
jgi:hypothetical protein